MVRKLAEKDSMLELPDLSEVNKLPSQEVLHIDEGSSCGIKPRSFTVYIPESCKKDDVSYGKIGIRSVS